MSGERRAGAVLPLAALLLGAPAAQAANLAELAVLGLRLGDSGSVVQTRHPSVFLSEVPYVDPMVGTRYEVGLGRVAVERLEGVGTTKDDRGRPVNLRVALTGDDRLFELKATEQVLGPIDCGARARELRATYGAPDVQVGQELLQWIEREGEIDRILEVRCFEEGRVSWRLADQRALAGYVADLRAPRPLHRAGARRAALRGAASTPTLPRLPPREEAFRAGRSCAEVSSTGSARHPRWGCSSRQSEKKTTGAGNITDNASSVTRNAMIMYASSMSGR
jgi:hypothetical protein